MGIPFMISPAAIPPNWMVPVAISRFTAKHAQQSQLPEERPGS